MPDGDVGGLVRKRGVKAPLFYACLPAGRAKYPVSCYNLQSYKDHLGNPLKGRTWIRRMNKNMAAKKKSTEVVKKTRVTPEELFEAGAHFGHMVKRWNPKMKKYIWGKKAGIHIFDLEKTVAKLDEACDALIKLAAEGKNIVLVGTKRQAKDIVKTAALENKIAYVTERWLGASSLTGNRLKPESTKCLT